MTTPVPAEVADQARRALAERQRRQGGGNRAAVVAAMELSTAPFVPDETLQAIGAWHAANPHAVTEDGRCTLLAGLYGGAAGRKWALESGSVTAASWLPEESATLEAFTAAADLSGGMICLYPDDPEALVVPGGDPAQNLHVTLAYVTEDAATLTPELSEVIHQAAQAGARVRSSPLLLTVVGYGTLGDADPPATVLFLQQNDGDGTDHQDGATAIARRVRAELDDYGSEAFPPQHDGFVAHLSLGYGLSLDAAKAFAGQQVKFSGGVSVTLAKQTTTYPWGGDGAQTAAASGARNWRRMSKRLARIDRDLQAKLLAGAQVAVTEALRRAGIKLQQRASRRSKAAQAAVDASGGRWSASVRAAAGVTESELLQAGFQSLGDEFEAWNLQAAEERLRIIAEEADLDYEPLAAVWLPRFKDHAATARAALEGALMGWAVSLLDDPVPSWGDVGEVPVDARVPVGLLGRALGAAQGRVPLTVDAPSGPGLVADLLVQHVGASAPVEVVTWRWNGSARPFPPHQEADGLRTVWSNYESTFGSPRDVYPFAERYIYVGDHSGCRCSYEYSYEPGGDV